MTSLVNNTKKYINLIVLIIAIILLIIIGDNYYDYYKNESIRKDADTFIKNIKISNLKDITIMHSKDGNNIFFDIRIKLDLSKKEILKEYESYFNYVESLFSTTDFKNSNISINKIVIYDSNGNGVITKELNKIYIYD